MTTDPPLGCGAAASRCADTRSRALLSGVAVAVRVLHVGDEGDVERVAGLVAAYAERPDQPDLSYASAHSVTGRGKSSTSKPFVQQLALLTKRAWWQYARQPVHIVARVAENRTRRNHTRTQPPRRPSLPAARSSVPMVCVSVVSVPDAVHRRAVLRGGSRPALAVRPHRLHLLPGLHAVSGHAGVRRADVYDHTPLTADSRLLCPVVRCKPVLLWMDWMWARQRQQTHTTPPLLCAA